jgi:4-hydroxy-2-oxoglutarate aldolase
MTREIATRSGRDDLPVIIGTVGQTTREIIAQLHASKAVGADFGLVLMPSYSPFALGAAAIQDFFVQVYMPVQYDGP